MRDGKLVRLERGGRLPDHCVFCNKPAHGAHFGQKLYRVSWTAAAFLILLATLGLSAVLAWGNLADRNFVAWIVLLGLLPSLFSLLMNTLARARKWFTVELGVCGTHRNMAQVGTVLNFLGALVLIGSYLMSRILGALSGPELFATLLVALSLHVVASVIGAGRIYLKRLTGDYAWLGGTGQPFRDALPGRPF